jgi:endonuclease/exonuclease/phosphatase (EEP) superfamily protein YafD
MCHGLAAGALAALAVAYAASDRHWIGAAFGLWPAWFWSPGILLLVVLGHRAWRWPFTLTLLAATIFFCLVFSEGLLLLRRPHKEVYAPFDEAHTRLVAGSGSAGTSLAEGFPLRVISWNLAGPGAGPDAVLAEMARYRPDLCFVQEVWHGTRDLPRTAIEAHLPGYSWSASPDCGLLSRFPIHGSKGLDLSQGLRVVMGQVTLPSSATITCISVHLRLYPLRLAIWGRVVRDETRRAMHERGEAMRRLEAAVRSHARGGGHVLVAGDWNVPASAKSLRPLRHYLSDAFLAGGSGWGNTMTDEFPVSRIDTILVSRGFNVVRCVAHSTGISDHRMVEADMWLVTEK